MMEFLKKTLSTVIDLIFPKDEGARAIDSITAEKLLDIAKLKEEPGNGIEAILSYRHPLAERLIWLLKYERSARAIELCAELVFTSLIDGVEEQLPKGRLPLLVPIPLSPARLRERGFNQTLLIAEQIQNIGGKEFFELRPDILLKIKDTKSQTKTKNREERLENLAGCFAAGDEASIHGRDIIILDDVTTTGTTFREAAKAFQKSGAKSVRCIAVAH